MNQRRYVSHLTSCIVWLRERVRLSISRIDVGFPFVCLLFLQRWKQSKSWYSITCRGTAAVFMSVLHTMEFHLRSRDRFSSPFIVRTFLIVTATRSCRNLSSARVILLVKLVEQKPHLRGYTKKGYLRGGIQRSCGQFVTEIWPVSRVNGTRYSWILFPQTVWRGGAV